MKIAGKFEEDVVTAKEKPTKGEVRSWSGDSYQEARNTGYANGVRTAGQESSLGSESTICNENKACRKVRRRRKR